MLAAEPFPDYYRVLEVSRDASQDDIKAAYRRWQRFYHPDYYMNRPEDVRAIATAKAAELNEAYAMLGDPERRAAYDELLREYETPNESHDDEEEPEGEKEEDIAEYLNARGFEVIDKRPAGGALWVLGGRREHEGFFRELRSAGYNFQFAPNGGRATGHEPAWYLRT